VKLLAIAIEIKNVPSTVVVAADVAVGIAVVAAAIAMAGVVIVGESISPASGADHYVNCVKDKGAGTGGNGIDGWFGCFSVAFRWVLLVASCCCCGDCCG